MTSCYSVCSTWWSSLKANCQLITIIVKTILVAIIKIRLVLCLYIVLTILADLKKDHQSGWLLHFLKLTTKPMLTFWVGEAELIELRFRCHMPATRP